MLVVPNVAALFTLKNIQDNQLVQTQGYSTEGIGSNLYRYYAISTSTIDGGFTLPGLNGTLSFSGTTFNGTSGTGRFIAIDTSEVDVTKFDAQGDGSTDDINAINLALAASNANRDASTYQATEVRFPSGRYLISAPIEMFSRQTIRGSGRSQTTILFVPTTGSDEGLAAISCEGGPTSNDFIYNPVIRDLSVWLDSGASQTAVRRYGIYMLYPQSALVSNVEIRANGALTSKDWVGIRTGREQGRFENITFNYMTVPVWLDTCDNNVFTNISAINTSTTASTLPLAAFYGPSTAAWDQCQFTGNLTVAGYDYGVHWTHDLDSGGFSLSGMRTEQSSNSSAYWIYLPGSQPIHTVKIDSCHFGTTVNGLYLRNIWNIQVAGSRFSSSAKVVDMNSSVVMNFTENTYADSASFSLGSGFTTTQTNVHLYEQNSRNWFAEWTVGATTPEMNPSFQWYLCTNSGATNVTAFSGTYFGSGRGIGHISYVFCDGNTTFVHSSSLDMISGSNTTPAAGEIIAFVKMFAGWVQIF